MKLTLDKAKEKSHLKIISVGGDRITRRRLMDFGLLPNTIIYYRKKAPLGDPIEITVKQTELSLRKSDAVNIIVENVA